ncbi:MAG TPA: hypothetical protein VHX64_16870, partial [Caulobacteraceae bacterium]|nr:hypothetical protein [Caulobacteraceae bacterium]
MNRLLKIAVREYLAYVRTAGFWLSLLLTPVGLSLGFVGPMMLARSAPPPRIAVVDLTGQGYAADIARALTAPHAARGGVNAGSPGVLIPSPAGPVSSPEDAGRKLRPYLERP